MLLTEDPQLSDLVERYFLLLQLFLSHMYYCPTQELKPENKEILKLNNMIGKMWRKMELIFTCHCFSFFSKLVFSWKNSNLVPPLPPLIQLLDCKLIKEGSELVLGGLTREGGGLSSVLQKPRTFWDQFIFNWKYLSTIFQASSIIFLKNRERGQVWLVTHNSKWGWEDFLWVPFKEKRG